MNHRYQSLDFSIETNEEFISIPLNSLSPTPSNALTLFQEMLSKLMFKSFLQVLSDRYMIWFLLMLILSFLPFSSILSFQVLLLLPFVLLVGVKQVKTFYSLRSQLKFQSRVNRQGVALPSGQGFAVQESKNIHQGDFLVIKKNEVSPCDCFILFIDNDSEDCCIRRQDLDNSEELEKRKAVKETSQIIENEGLNLEIFRNSIESLKVRKNSSNSPTSSRDLAGFICMKNYSQTIKVSYANMVQVGDVVLECEWILCIAVRVGRQAQCWTDYDINLSKFQGSHAHLINSSNFCSLVMIIFCIVLTEIFSQLSRREDSVVDSVLFSLVLFGCNLPISLYLLFEIVEILNFFIAKKFFSDAPLSSPASISKLASVEYILSEKVGVLTKRQVKVFFCIVSNTLYQESLFENNEENRPLQLLSSFSVEKLENLHFCTFSELGQALAGESYISKKWVFCVSLAICNSFRSKLSLACTNSVDKAALQFANEIGLEIVSRSEKTFLLTFRNCEYSFTILAQEPLNPSFQVSLVKDEISELFYLIFKEIHSGDSDLHLIHSQLLKQELDKSFPSQSKVLYFYLKVQADEVKSLLFQYDSAKKTSINQVQRLVSIFAPLIAKCKLLGVLGFENLINRETIESVQNIQAAGIQLWLVSSTSETSVLATCHQLGLLNEELPVVQLSGYLTAAQAYTAMINVLNRNISEITSKRRNSEQRDTEISGRVLNPRSEVVHPLMFDLGYLRKHLKISKKIENIQEFFINVQGQVLDLVSQSKEVMKAFVYLLFSAKGAAFYDMLPGHKKILVAILQNELSFQPVVMSVGCCDGAGKMIAQADIGVKVLDEKNSNTFYSDISIKSFSALEKLLQNLGFQINFQYRFIEKLYTFKVLSTVSVLFFFQPLCDFSSFAVVDYDLLVAGDLFISFFLIAGSSYFLIPTREMMTETKKSFRLKSSFPDLPLLKTGFLAVLSSGLTILIVSQTFTTSLSPDGQTADNETIALVLFLSLNLLLFSQVLIHPVYQKGFIFVCFGFFAMLTVIVSTIFYRNHEKNHKSFENSVKFAGFWLVLILVPGLIFVLTYSLDFCLSCFGSKSQWSRFLQFKTKFNSLFSDNLKWALTGSLKSFHLDRWRMMFVDDKLEADYRVKEYHRKRIVLRLYLLAFTMIQLLNISMEYAGKAVFLEIGNFSFIIGAYILTLLLLSLFVPASLITYIEASFFLLLASLSIVKPLLNSSNSSIPRYPTYAIIFILDLNLTWRTTLIKSLVLYSISLFAAVHECLSSDPEGLDSKVSIWSVSFFFNMLLILFTSYLKDFHRRKNFYFIQKFTREVEKSSAILSYFLPEFVKHKSKDGLGYVAEDKGTVSVIYCEIFEFSKLVQENDCQALALVLQDFSKKLDFLCESCGTVMVENSEKHFLAFAGLEDSEELLDSNLLKVSHARRAVELALAVCKEVSNALGDRKTLSVKIGIHSGPVVAGVVGSVKPQLVLLGETVKTAKALAKTLIEVDSVQLSMNSFELLNDLQGLAFKENRVELKGCLTDTKIVNYPSLNYDLDSLDDVYIKFIRRKSSFVGQFYSSNRIHEFLSDSDTEQGKKSGRSERRSNSSKKSANFDQGDFEHPKNFKIILRSFCRSTQEEKDFCQEYSSEIKECQLAGLFISMLCDFLLIISELVLVLGQAKYSSYTRLVMVLTGEGLMVVLYICQKRYMIRGLLCYTLSVLYSLQFVLVFVSSAVTSERNLIYLVYYYYKYTLLCFFTGTVFSKNLYFQLTMAVIWLVDLFKNYPDYQSLVYTIFFFLCNVALAYRQEASMRNNLALKALVKLEFQKTHKNLIQTLPPKTSESLEKMNENLEIIPKVSLLYAKILNFQEWAKLRRPNEVIEVLSCLFSQFDQLCPDHSVYKVYTKGEKYFAIGHFSQNSRKYQAEVSNLVNFAFDMRGKVEKVNQMFFTSFQITVGLHLGEVFARTEGVKVVKFQVYGPHVEFCKTLAKSADDGMVCVSSKVKKVLEKDQKILIKEVGQVPEVFGGSTMFSIWKDEV